MNDTAGLVGIGQVKFDIVVPFNNEVLVKARKKQKIKTGILLLFVTALFVAFTVFASLSANTLAWAVAIFAVFAIISLLVSVCAFCTTKPNKKHDSKSVRFGFYEECLQIYQDNGLQKDDKLKLLAYCLYRKYANKQYVSKVIETSDSFQIKILTGTYNAVPQYVTHMVPKSVLPSEEDLNSLKEFLEQKVGTDYKIKVDK